MQVSVLDDQFARPVRRGDIVLDSGRVAPRFEVLAVLDPVAWLRSIDGGAYATLACAQLVIVERPAPKMLPTIQLASGGYFDFLSPWTSPMLPTDIAQSLSKQCRYTGHLVDEASIYSVAQHCVLASQHCEPGYEFEALMHDGPEFVLGDVSSPLKQLLPDYKALEEQVTEAFCARFHLPHPTSERVKFIDIVMLATEKRDLMAPDDPSVIEWKWTADYPTLGQTIKAWTPQYARARWLRRFCELWPEHLAKQGLPAPDRDALIREVGLEGSFLGVFPQAAFGVEPEDNYGKTRDDCRARFDNMEPFRGAPELAPNDIFGDIPFKPMPDGSAYTYVRAAPLPGQWRDQHECHFTADQNEGRTPTRFGDDHLDFTKTG